MIYDLRYFYTFELKIIKLLPPAPNYTFIENKYALVVEVFSSKEWAICKFIHGFRIYIDLPVNNWTRELFPLTVL